MLRIIQRRRPVEKSDKSKQSDMWKVFQLSWRRRSSFFLYQSVWYTAHYVVFGASQNFLGVSWTCSLIGSSRSTVRFIAAMRSVVRGSAFIALAEGSQTLFAPAPAYTVPQQAYGNPAYVQLADAQSPVTYVQPIAVQAAPTEQGSSWADMAMLAVAGAVVGGAIGYAAKARAGDAQMIEPMMRWTPHSSPKMMNWWNFDKHKTFENRQKSRIYYLSLFMKKRFITIHHYSFLWFRSLKSSSLVDKHGDEQQR